MKRREVITKIILATGGSSIIMPSVLKASTNNKVTSQMLSKILQDQEFIGLLVARGIKDAAKEMGIDFDKFFLPMTESTNHPYRSYRWSVSRDEFGNPVIHALPPEEEMGWTPWERWSLKNNRPIRSAWVLYPVKQSLKRGVINWYVLEDSENLFPRILSETPNLVAQLSLARIDLAAEWLGLDFQKVFIDPLPEEVQNIYKQYRWVVVPHVLALNGPVIYALPPISQADDWPWESWYTDGHHPHIHHVHYTKRNPSTTGKWSEGTGAPQRPSEIFGVTWYWYNDFGMVPALAGKTN